MQTNSEDFKSKIRKDFNMKKIGLMTWFTYDNFGSLLQCQATIKTVKKLGYDIELINYKPRENYSTQNILTLSKKVIKKIKRLCKKTNKHKLVEKNNYILFRNELPKSRVVNEKSDLFMLNKEYDAFICGSDQIWAPTVFDENYFLSFVNDNEKKIAYAPSIGLPVIDNSLIKNKMTTLISQFKYLSIREVQGANLIKDLTQKEAKVVLDPTLLLTKEEWANDFVDVNYKNYILAYFLGDNENYYKICKKIAEKLNKKLLIIPTTEIDFSKEETIYDDLGPKEFISLINNADFVLTDSFHGTIFSINFNKPFISFKRFKDNKTSQNSRIYNILKKLNLEALLFNNNIDAVINSSLSIDYFSVNKILTELRKESINYLRTSLIDATKKTNKNEQQIITNNCTGCGVCSTICPKQCITIELNKNGFYEYKINQNDCIHCYLCEKVCGQNRYKNSLITFDKLNVLYSGFATDNNIRSHSSSGGICTAIATDFIKKGNSVIGCEYDTTNHEAKFNIYTNIKSLSRMQGSKYIQANTLETLNKLKDIENGVIFGTPCQISSIDLYLKMKNKRNNFLLIDFICHGVPSYHLWKKYIKQFNDIKNVNFRDKEKGWRKKYISIIAEKSKIIIQEDKDYFYKFFEMSNIYNECCYECKYRDVSPADIRVGDYWGPRYKNNEEGTSMIIPITEYGKNYLKYLEDESIINDTVTTMKDYYSYQQIKNQRIPLEYNLIINDLKNPNISLKEIDKKYNSKKRKRNKLRKIIYKFWSR